MWTIRAYSTQRLHDYFAHCFQMTQFVWLLLTLLADLFSISLETERNAMRRRFFVLDFEKNYTRIELNLLYIGEPLKTYCLLTPIISRSLYPWSPLCGPVPGICSKQYFLSPVCTDGWKRRKWSHLEKQHFFLTVMWVPSSGKILWVHWVKFEVPAKWCIFTLDPHLPSSNTLVMSPRETVELRG